MRILIAEDDEKLASLVAETLKASGFVVEIEADGEVALYRGDWRTATLARIRALMRRARHVEPSDATMRLGPLAMDLSTHSVTIRRMFSVPARWPASRSRPRALAHLPLPSMMIATWWGTVARCSAGLPRVWGWVAIKLP